MNQELDQPIINIRGDKVGLGPLDESIISLQTAWINNFATTRTLGASTRPRTLAEHEQWFQHMTTHDSGVAFTIYHLADTVPVGTVNLFDIDQRHRTCELGVSIMPLEYRGRGLGTEAVRLITDYAIHALGMHNVRLSTLEFNTAGFHAYRKAGFREYGRRRQAWFHNGRWWDIVYMEALASEWESPVVKQMMTPEKSHQ